MSAIFNPYGIFYSTFNPDELNRKSFAQTMMRLYPNGGAPLFGMTSMVKPSKPAVSTSHGYFTKTFIYPKIKVNGAIVAGTTTLVVDSTTGVVPGMVYQVPSSRENIRVTAVVNGTDLTITRAFGRVAAAGINDDEDLLPAGNAHTQTSSRPVERSIQSTYVPNYTQIIRNAWALSNSSRESLTELGYSNFSENKQDCSLLHSQDIESALLWSQAQAPAGSPLTHSTQGVIDSIYQFAPGNITTAGATTSWDQLVTAVAPAFEYSSNLGGMSERVGFCDSTGMKVLTAIGESYAEKQITLKETSFGMIFTEFQFYKGKIRLFEHPHFNGAGVPDPGILLIVDLPAMALAYLGSRNAKVESYDGSKDSTEQGKDATGGGLLSEFATEFKNPQACALINNLTAAA